RHTRSYGHWSSDVCSSDLVGFAAAAHFDGFYTYDFMNFGGAKFARLCAQAHAAHLLCAPSVGPGYDGSRAGESPGGRGRKKGQRSEERRVGQEWRSG